MGQIARVLTATARTRVAEYELMIEQCQDGVHWPSGMTRIEIAGKLQEARRMLSLREAEVLREEADV
jgi:hypothetical protein